MNKLMTTVRLGSDPEVRTAGSGSVTSFSAASNTRTKDENGDFITNWYRCSVWGKLGEIAAKNLHKGSQIFLCGDLTVRNYTDRNGGTRQSLDINVTDIDFGGDRPASAEHAAEKNTRPAMATKSQSVKTAVVEEDELPF